MKDCFPTTHTHNTHRHTDTHRDTRIDIIYIYIYMYIYIYIRGAYDKFPDMFRMGIQNCRTHLKIQYVTAINLMRWLTNFYDFRFKSTATATIGIHTTKASLLQLVNFKNDIWHFRRTICNRIMF